MSWFVPLKNYFWEVGFLLHLLLYCFIIFTIILYLLVIEKFFKNPNEKMLQYKKLKLVFNTFEFIVFSQMKFFFIKIIHYSIKGKII